MMNMQLVCCCDRAPQLAYYTYREMLKSLSRYQITPHILGFGSEWKGLGSKPKLLLSAIERGVIAAPVVIFFDAWDVVFAQHPEQIVWKLFGREGAPDKIVWNAEKSCFPDASLADKHPASTSPWKFLNSGVAIGSADLFRAALAEMNARMIPDDVRLPDGRWVHQNDQDTWMRQFLFGHVPMGLDTRCEVFQTLCSVDISELDLSGPAIRNAITGTEPVVFHFNGPAKTAGLREPILSKLSL